MGTRRKLRLDASDNHMVLHKVLVTVDAWRGAALSKRCPFALGSLCRMLLSRCAGCSADLTNVVPRSAAKQCGRCRTPYCGRACQEQHWKEGGHDKICKKIKKGGGYEQYHADKKYAEAVAAAVEKCADDTKGQTCYICTHDLREAVTTLTKAARISKRVLGGAHPLAAVINEDLGESKDALQLKKDFSG